jgi:uncharacterized protein (TIGR02996 family)
MNPTESALLQAVIASPDDDLPRLVLADWLEENGQPERAEFIRVQIDLDKCQWQGDLIEPWGRHLVHREIQLLGVDDSDKWFPGPTWLELVADTQVKDGYRFPDGSRSGILRRGFVSEVRCTLTDWCGGECPCFTNEPDYRHERCGGTGYLTGIGPAVVRSHPVEVVVLTDREPWEERQGVYGWWRETPDGDHTELPPYLFDVLAKSDPDYHPFNEVVWYSTAEAAVAALSALLIAWAKSQPHQARIESSPVHVDFAG